MQRKQIAFDLDTEALKKYYPKGNWRTAYEDIRGMMKKYGFVWVQGSVYESVHEISGEKVTPLIEAFLEQYPWLNLCMRDCKMTNIGKSYNLNYLFDSAAEIPSRQHFADVKKDAIYKASEANANSVKEKELSR